MRNEIPIKVCDCRRELGIGATLMSAVLQRMGISGAHRVMKSRVSKFIAENPTFKITDVYRKSKKVAPTTTARHDTFSNQQA